MKKILASLLVLALCAPAMAVTVNIATDGTVTLDSTEDGVAMVGIALDLDVDGGQTVTGLTVDTANFNIYPDAAYTEELGDGYAYGEGTPIAAKLVAGEIALPQSSFAVCFANLNGETTAGADGATSVQFTVTPSAACNLTIIENATRGGIVAVDGTALDISGVTGGSIGPDECFSSAAGQKYTDWLAFGSPDCWCYQRQCNGDADGGFQGSTKTGLLAVYTNDLTILSNAYNIAEPPKGVGVDATGICADFDHAAQGSTKTGLLRVYTNDLTLLSNNYNVAEPPKGVGVPVCPLTTSGGDIVFYTN